MDDTIFLMYYESPCGRLRLGSLDGWLCLCDWVEAACSEKLTRRLKRLTGAEVRECATSVTEATCKQLDEYFGGQRRKFEVPLMFAGTDFQRLVWSHMAQIPFGAKESYAALARRVGCSRAVRGVANAVGANPLSIIVPCHRVIGSDGSLTGYAGGLAAKRYLLDLECSVFGPVQFAAESGGEIGVGRHEDG